MSNSDVSSKNLFQRIPWKIALPVVTVLLNLWLRHLDRLWSIGAGKWDDLAVTSAEGLRVLLNGPAVRFFDRFLPNGLVWVLIIVFWWWVGWLIDRRFAGNRSAVIRPRWVAGGFYALGFALGALLLWVAVIQVRFNQYYPWLFQREFWASPKVHLLGPEIITLGMMIWGLICLLYFGDKLLGLTFRHPAASGG